VKLKFRKIVQRVVLDLTITECAALKGVSAHPANDNI